MNEAGSTSIQEDGTKATKGTEESKQVDTKSNHGEETKESKHVEPKSSVQVKVEKINGKSTNKEGSAIEDAVRGNKQEELSEMQQGFKAIEQQKKTLQNELATTQRKMESTRSV